MADDTALAERDERVAEALESGRSLRMVRREFSLTQSDLDAALERLWPVDNQARLRMIKGDLGKLDKLAEVFFAKALGGDVQSGAVTVKIWERKHALLGLDSPTRIDLQVQPQQAPSRHELITQAVMRLRGKPVDGNGSPDAVDALSDSGDKEPSH